MDKDFLNFIQDEEVKPLLTEWLKPTDNVLNGINQIISGTVLENCYCNAEQTSDNSMTIHYYLEKPISSDDMNTLHEKQVLIDDLDLPFHLVLKVYEPALCMKLEQKDVI